MLCIRKMNEQTTYQYVDKLHTLHTHRDLDVHSENQFSKQQQWQSAKNLIHQLHEKHYIYHRKKITSMCTYIMYMALAAAAAVVVLVGGKCFSTMLCLIAVIM